MDLKASRKRRVGTNTICSRRPFPDTYFQHHVEIRNMSYAHTKTGGYVTFTDLSIPLYLEQVYDWVLSFEVGEHIPAEYEDVFFGNMVRHANEGIVLSWSVEGQGGHFHVNNHNNDYVINRMLNHGFCYDQELSDKIREAANLIWFKNTIMVFRRE